MLRNENFAFGFSDIPTGNGTVELDMQNVITNSIVIGNSGSVYIKVNKDGNEDTQIQIVNQHLKNLEGNNIFVDRCLLDCMAYTTWMFNKGQINQNTFNYVKEKYEDNVNRYDIIFYLRPEFKIVDDGFRSLDIKFRDEVLEIFEELVKNLKNVKVLTGSVDERIKTILNYI